VYVLDAPAGPVGVILPPKTGTRSVEKVLRGLGAKKLAGRHGVDKAALRDCRAVYSTLRNPFDVLVSWFHYRPPAGVRDKSFEMWFDLSVRQGRNGYLNRGRALPHATLADRFMRHENGLASELNRMLTEVGREPAEVPHIGAAENRRGYRAYYSPALRDEVMERFHLDFDTFGYSF
jgi:hypothetical protein